MDRSGANEDTYPMLVISRLITVTYLPIFLKWVIVSYLICMFQDSVPAGSYNDPFLSSVISMVAPTWCHGAI